ncbi:MAG: hypothetical protein ACAI35_19690 [Candidatus Methylacidiphilales bacterium]
MTDENAAVQNTDQQWIAGAATATVSPSPLPVTESVSRPNAPVVLVPYNPLPVNPFERDLVKQPREARRSVESLNDAPFKTLLQRFAPLDSGETPRKDRRSDKAQLVMSPSPGYGKSHLIGRLFYALDDRATLVYLTAFESVSKCWETVLGRVVRELDYPDSTDQSDWSPTEPMQLDAFARGVVLNLFAGAIDGGVIPMGPDVDRAEQAAWYRTSPEINLQCGEDPASTYLREEFLNELLPVCERELHRLSISLRRPGWLRVLFQYANSPAHSPKRSACLAWIRGENTDDADRELLGLLPAEAVTIHPAEERNDFCRERLLDLCDLAAFYRPFMFCFDQTEDYADSEALTRAFGKVVTRLVNEAMNLFIVVTTNQSIWERRMVPALDVAHRDRFSKPVVLQGLDRDQAAELIALRLHGWDVPKHIIAQFSNSAWLEEILPGRSSMGAREFMQLCRDRWDAGRLEGAGVVIDEGATEGHHEQSLDEYFAEYVAEHGANPRWLEYDADILRWLVKHPLAMGGNVQCQEHQDPNGYFEERWEVPGQAIVLFGFTREMDWRQWLGLANQVTAWHAGQSVPVAKAVIFRTQELPLIPKPTWIKAAPVIESAKANCLQLVVLDPAETAELYAARDLFAEANGGSVGRFTGADVVEFLAHKLERWREALLLPMNTEPELLDQPRSGMAENQTHATAGGSMTVESDRELLGDLLHAEKFMSADDAALTLSEATNSPWNGARVVAACDGNTNIRRYPHEEKLMLVWKDSIDV